MNCFYCDQIRAADPGYQASPAAYDLGSEAPRCARHWRYVCGACGRAAHFMAMALCAQSGRLYCRTCARGVEEAAEAFWAWGYHFRYRSPWSGEWHVSLDRLEYEGLHPMQRGGTLASLSDETYLERYPTKPTQWRVEGEMTDVDAQRSWDANADRWDAGYDDDGDANRRYQSDEPMLELLGEVKGLRVLDAGSGGGYLCRKLAGRGAHMVGVELSQRFFDLAMRREAQRPLGIQYVRASLSDMPMVAGHTFDKAVSNYVLMDVADVERAVAEVHRVLVKGGVFVAVISHPCFGAGEGWRTPAPDSPRREDRRGWLVDHYFKRGAYMGVWGGFDPVLSFHRPMMDYLRLFRQAGFSLADFYEPSVTERGRRELSPSRLVGVERIPYSCMFKLVK